MRTWILAAAAALVVSCAEGPHVREAPRGAGHDSRGQAAAAAEHAEIPGESPAPADPVPEAPRSGPQGSGPSESESFLVTAEVYSRTLDEVTAFIRNLNEIIRRRDCAAWLTHLSEEYVRHVGDPEYLREQSEMPLLKKNNVVLGTLEDYFEYVVAPSRSQATVDDIEFIDENHVKAISSIRGTRGILYHLVRSNGSWKIDLWE